MARNIVVCSDVTGIIAAELEGVDQYWLTTDRLGVRRFRPGDLEWLLECDGTCKLVKSRSQIRVARN